MSTEGFNEPTQYDVLRNLAERGWISLRQTAILLGYSTPRGIYARQKGRNALDTISVGGIERVYRETIITELKRLEDQIDRYPEKGANAAVMLSLLQVSEPMKGDDNA